MENYSKSEILQMVEEEDVEFIRLQLMFGNQSRQGALDGGGDDLPVE